MCDTQQTFRVILCHSRHILYFSLQSVWSEIFRRLLREKETNRIASGLSDRWRNLGQSEDQMAHLLMLLRIGEDQVRGQNQDRDSGMRYKEKSVRSLSWRGYILHLYYKKIELLCVSVMIRRESLRQWLNIERNAQRNTPGHDYRKGLLFTITPKGKWIFCKKRQIKTCSASKGGTPPTPMVEIWNEFSVK